MTTTKEKLKSFFSKFGKTLSESLFPPHIKCVFCADELNEKDINDTCEKCFHSLPFIRHACPRCGGELTKNNEGVCFNCKMTNFNFELARSIFSYGGKIKSAIYKYKYGGAKYLSEPFAIYLINYLTKWEIKPDYITTIPLHHNREKSRGYNQSKCMAEIVAKNFNIEYKDFCIKIKDNPHQAKLGLKERKENVKDAYQLMPELRKIIKGKTILIIDDVFTTGATANEVSRILRQAKPKRIYILTLAHEVVKNQL